jgi:hypothetical protein
MSKIQLYAIISLGAFSVASGIALFVLWGWYDEVKDELKTVQIAREKAESNLQLVSDQLENERETREAAEAALSDLRAVPDVDYQTPLPPSIGNVLIDFRDRMQ